MKAIVCRQFGPIGGLELAEVDAPQPGPGEVVIRAEACGVNFPDGLLVQGLYQFKPPLPFVPGMEVVGEIVSVGSQVTRFKPGQRVGAVTEMGAWAEAVKARENALRRVDPEADAGELLALMCGYGTAQHGLKQRAGLKPGETLAVTGAAGLTGLAAVQIGTIMGAKVIAIASTVEKRQLALKNGADVALPYDSLKESLKAETGGQGVDVAFDGVGGDAFDSLARNMAWGGRLLVVGFASGNIPQFPVNLALVKGYSVVGVFWGSFCQREPLLLDENNSQLMAWYNQRKLRPHVERVFPLAEAAKALQFIHNRQATGKIVLKP